MEERDVTLIGDLWTNRTPGIGQGDPGPEVSPVDVVDPVTIVGDPPATSGWPAPVPLRADNWRETDQGLRYMLIMGDTLSGMSATYLGRPERWREIWDLNSARLRPLGRTPDSMFEGDLLVMPNEAIAVAAGAGLLEHLPSGDDFAKATGKKNVGRNLAIGGVGGAAVGGGLGYAVGRSPLGAAIGALGGAALGAGGGYLAS